MRFFSSFFLICSAALLLSVQPAVASLFDLISPNCIKLLTTINGRTDTLFYAYQKEICSKGCTPSVSDWDEWTYTNVFLPTVEALVVQTGMTDTVRERFLEMGNDVATLVKRDCRKQLQGKHFCAEPEALQEWGRCFKTRFVTVAIKKGVKLLPFITNPEICRRELLFFDRDELWHEILPGYMRLSRNLKPRHHILPSASIAARLQEKQRHVAEFASWVNDKISGAVIWKIDDCDLDNLHADTSQADPICVSNDGAQLTFRRDYGYIPSESHALKSSTNPSGDV
ncbi:conserved hypothetical protein [Paecilomyces variotii No. 5]|uniref:Uncharacterized protein n=1 Tax=Byssochlamys spectabilis (strain No. 5 / NBRC 109023) TaxID=1356009 RepID=V5FUX9_BYSSN|nr:conserved hypothetical protein [Paecilomyces variotii No. 5]